MQAVIQVYADGYICNHECGQSLRGFMLQCLQNKLCAAQCKLQDMWVFQSIIEPEGHN